jgi:hypothetical protein
MRFSFYPRHEYGCKQVSLCPHLGGAGLGTLVLLVLLAKENEQRREPLYRQLDAERGLRTLVIPRTITFGHRTPAGAVAMARIMSLQETAKRHGRKVLEILYRMWTKPPDRLLRYLYAGPGMAGS